MRARAAVGAYVLREIDHPVPLRIVGPDSYPRRHHSRAVSYIQMNPDEFCARFSANKYVEFLNEVDAAWPGAPDKMLNSVLDWRRAMDRWLSWLGVPTKKSQERDGSRWASPGADLYHHVEDVLHAVGAVTSVLTDEIFGGQDPSKVDRRVSRTGGSPAMQYTNRKGQLRTDTDRRLRLGRDPTCAPRFGDPNVYDLWQEGLVRVRASEAVLRAHGLARFAGPRACSVLALTLADVFLSKPGQIAALDKGSRGQRTLTLVPARSEYDRMLGYVAGPRAELSGVTIEQIRAMAKDPRRRADLAKMPLLTEDGVSFVKYDRLYRVSRKAAVLMDLFVNDGSYVRTGIKRYVSFHWLRHEYVHQRLDYIVTIEKGQSRAKKALVAYMGWSSEGMLDWYSAHHVRKLSNAAAREYNEQVESMLSEEAVPVSARLDCEAVGRLQLAGSV